MQLFIFLALFLRKSAFAYTISIFAALALAFALISCGTNGTGQFGTAGQNPQGAEYSGEYGLPKSAEKLSANLEMWADQGTAKTATVFGRRISVAQLDKHYGLLAGETAALSVVKEGDGVRITSPSPLPDVYIYVGYDPAVISPAGVEFGGAFRQGGEYISLAVDSVPGHVGIGLASFTRNQPAEAGTIYVRFEDSPFRKSSNREPSADRDDDIGIMIADMFVLPGMAGENQMQWQVIIQGDLDGNGEVGIPDITPIALNYLNLFGDGINDEVDWYLNLASDRDDEIGIADITPIAQNYMSSGPAGYDVFKVWSGDGTFEYIENELNPGQPTVSADMGETSEMAPVNFAITDSSTSGPSSLRRPSMINSEGDGWAMGDFHYVIDPRLPGEDNPPDEPRKMRFNVHVRYDSPFRIQAGEEVELFAGVIGADSVSSYRIDWGDRTRETIDTGEREISATHTFDSNGRYFPMVSVTGIVNGSEVVIHQRALPVVVAPLIPPAPTGLSISPSGGGEVTMNWEPSPVPEATYNLYACIRRSETRPMLIAEGLSATTFDWDGIASLAEGMKAFIKATVVVDGAESPFSAEVQWPPVDVPPPFLRIMPTTTDTSIDLEWSSVPDTEKYNVLGYALFATTDLGGGNVVRITPDPGLPENVTSFNYTPDASEKLLYFFARTIADSGISSRSNEEVWIHGSMLDTIPTAEIAVFPVAGPPPLTVNFEAPDCIDPDGFITGYFWRFFQGGPFKDYTSTYGAAQYTYTNSGLYTATLLVVDNEGNKFFKNALISATELPVAVANADVTSGMFPLSVSFDGSASYDPDGTIKAWDWDFDGNGKPDFRSYESGIANFVYNAPGAYNATLTVHDNLGAKSVDKIRITVADALGNLPPTAEFIASATEGRAPLEITFDASGSFDGDGVIVNYAWDFDGDGTTDFESALPSANRLFDIPGVFFATLTVTDDGGLSDEAVLRIVVGVQILLAPPVNVSASQGEFPDKISLSWSHPDIGTTPDGYKIIRADTPVGPYVQKAILGLETQFEDTDVIPGVTYWYRIESLKQGLPDSNPSIPVSGFASLL